jgi:hypothetical protein
MFQKIWATCEIAEYVLSTVNPLVDNDAETPTPILEKTFHKLDLSIDNTDVKYLTVNMENLLEQIVASQLVCYVMMPFTLISFCDRLCGLVLRAPGCRSRGPDSILG